MPTLTRLLIVLGLLAGAVFGAMFALVALVEPEPREMAVTVPQSRLAPK